MGHSKVRPNKIRKIDKEIFLHFQKSASQIFVHTVKCKVQKVLSASDAAQANMQLQSSAVDSKTKIHITTLQFTNGNMDLNVDDN